MSGPSQENPVAMTSENTLEYPETAPMLTVAEVAGYIQRGEPLPGVKQIPPTLSDQPPTPSAMQPRRKPWEPSPADHTQTSMPQEEAST